MEDNELEAYKKAGSIAKEVREWSKNLLKPGEKIFEIAEKIEDKIKSAGAEVAFPVNICINDITAHYTPKFQEDTSIGEEDVVKVDIGVHVDGYIADTAYTIDFSGKYKRMLEVNEKALNTAIEMIKPGALVSEIGRAIYECITKEGFKPIENLTGHEIKRYDLHAGISIPNIPVPYNWKIKKDMVLAIEPFVTNGYGRVVESKRIEIFSFLDEKPTRIKEARSIIEKAREREKLPFAQRWFSKDFSTIKLDLIFRDLTIRKILKSYPILHEKEKGIVSQFEHTVIVTDNGCEVITE
ncbi:MAG: type II methionyl aminopeptidase [Candidatus Altiarchaeota archaeon]